MRSDHRRPFEEGCMLYTYVSHSTFTFCHFFNSNLPRVVCNTKRNEYRMLDRIDHKTTGYCVCDVQYRIQPHRAFLLTCSSVFLFLDLCVIDVDTGQAPKALVQECCGPHPMTLIVSILIRRQYDTARVYAHTASPSNSNQCRPRFVVGARPGPMRL